MNIKLIEQFIELIDSNYSKSKREDTLYFKQLLNFNVNDGADLIEIVKRCPNIIVENITVNSTVFDYFYEKTLLMSDFSIWSIHIRYILSALNAVENNEKIKDEPYYIKNLQEKEESHNTLFELLVINEFTINDPEELIYTIIARGESNKIKTISDIYIIEDYIGIFDVAVKYGRCEIIEFLMKNLELNTELFGKILDFENFNRDIEFKEISSIQNYIRSVELILKDYQYPVTLKTLHIWCDFINKHDCRKWENELIELLKVNITFNTDDIVKHDFGRFNSLIFDKEDTDFLTIKDQNTLLQEKLSTLESRYNNLLEINYKLLREIDNLNYRLVKKHKLVDSRTRSDST